MQTATARAHGENTPALSPDEESHPFGKPPETLPSLSDVPKSRVVDRSGIELEIIDLANKKDRRRFLEMAPPLYAGDPNFIAPLMFERDHFLNPDKNKGLEGLEIRPILALQGGRIVGRISAHIDHHYNEYHGAKAGWFGFFECVNDKKVAHAMLDEATNWLKSKGMTEAIGPMNFTTNHQAGLLVENFSRPATVEMTYNPPYYEELLTSFGFGKAKDLLAWWIDVSNGRDDPKIERIAKVADRTMKRAGIRMRHLEMEHFEREVELLFDLYNRAWQKNWGFVPLTKAGFEAIVNDLKQIVRPELLLFIYKGDEAVAFSCTLPDINQAMPKNGRLLPFGWLKILLKKNRVKHARLFTLGVVEEHRKRGFETMLMVETALASARLGMASGEIGWTLEDNDLINKAIEQMGGHKDRVYRLLGVSLEG